MFTTQAYNVYDVVRLTSPYLAFIFPSELIWRRDQTPWTQKETKMQRLPLVPEKHLSRGLRAWHQTSQTRTGELLKFIIFNRGLQYDLLDVHNFTKIIDISVWHFVNTDYLQWCLNFWFYRGGHGPLLETQGLILLDKSYMRWKSRWLLKKRHLEHNCIISFRCSWITLVGSASWMWGRRKTRTGSLLISSNVMVTVENRYAKNQDVFHDTNSVYFSDYPPGFCTFFVKIHW